MAAKADNTKVTRIKATSSAPKKGMKKSIKTVKATKIRKAPTNPFLKALFAATEYFKGAWAELRQVRWPTRQATWGLTFAVIVFSAFFVVIIVLLDLLFKYLFELILS